LDVQRKVVHAETQGRATGHRCFPTPSWHGARRGRELSRWVAGRGRAERGARRTSAGHMPSHMTGHMTRHMTGARLRSRTPANPRAFLARSLNTFGRSSPRSRRLAPRILSGKRASARAK
jgi:hypothetical protein